jgi:FdhD protein
VTSRADTEPTRVRPGATSPATVTVVSADGTRSKPDVVSTEEPLEIRIGDQAVAVTMRTPGHDFELAVGYLFTEGILGLPGDLNEVRYCTKDLGGPGVVVPQEYNIVTVDMRTDVDPERLRRATVTSSSCGLCGTDSIEHIASMAHPLELADGPRLPADVLLRLPDTLRTRQPQFSKTGGLHGVGLFDAAGKPVVVREDVGRHNALDKVIGERLLRAPKSQPLALTDLVLAVSGRVSFEIVQKAAMARIAWIVAVGAPTSLAIGAADELGITLVGFVNGESANVYTSAHRIT